MERTIHVISSDPFLGAALERRLARSGFVASLDAAGDEARMRSGDIVVAPVSDCSLRRLRSLVARHLHVLVVAPSPTTDDRLHYLDAGASDVLPMHADGANLEAALGRLLDRLGR